MRQAFERAVKNPALLAEAEAMKLDMLFRKPDHLEQTVAQLYATPPELVEKAKEISPNLKEMDPRIFRPGPMGLSRSFAELPARPRRVA